MRKTYHLAIAGILASGVSISVSAGDISIPPKSVSNNIRTAVTTQYPNADIRGYSLESKSPRLVEVELNDSGIERSVVYRSDGTVVETESTLALSQLPEAVRKGVLQAAPGAHIASAEQYTRSGTTGYEVVVQYGETREELTLDSQGKVLSKENQADSEDSDSDSEDDTD